MKTTHCLMVVAASQAFGTALVWRYHAIHADLSWSDVLFLSDGAGVAAIFPLLAIFGFGFSWALYQPVSALIDRYSKRST